MYATETANRVIQRFPETKLVVTPEKYVPDYIIYDELKRQRQERASREERPRLEMPRYIPYWPDAGFGEPGEDHSKEEDESDSQERGVVIIQMC